ncbi:ABC transporter substrate-binding protein [Oscillibacter hominis]|uniref:ABC transporter substrate-binding protein n=1 Tax=Oscillibacter hominis TaxID=2763056 RepID=A0A7G9B4K7_9FIRM|nr:ABC transporter substrate-binding protein [Oscillibacter hominis]QNL44488.1 ABC transporter substrate-binding protein [Oscillibacter hominis]
MKRMFTLLLALALCASLLAGCGNSGGSSSGSGSGSGSSSGAASGGEVYYLNFKPEQDGDWKALAKAYTEETGVPVTVVTAASGDYETTLMAEMGKSEAPTLFQVNGPVGLKNWQDYCYDLSDTAIYGELTSDDFALKGEDGSGVYGIAYVIETYGIICNKALLEQAGYSVEDITNFESLKKVAEDITARKGELGFSAFTSAGMDGSSDWRFKTHLANLPIYYEYENEGIHAEAIQGTYLDNYKAIWDLYINNATCAPSELSAKTGDDAVAEFVGGQAVFYQNGTWAYNDVKDLGDENLDMLPIYIGVDGEEDQGLCTGSENYWCVNKDAAPEDIQATLDFLYWVVTSETGTTSLADDMGFVCPFKSAKPSANYLVGIADQYIADGKKSVDWCFPTMPSEEWKNGVGSALTAYAAGTGTWDAVVTAFVDGWASEYQLANG